MKKLIALLILNLSTVIAFSQKVPCPSTIDYHKMKSREPARYQRFMNLEKFTANYVAQQGNPNGRLINSNSTIVIPVVVHVLHRNEAVGVGRNISLQQIQSQIEVLNEDFRRLNTDAINTPAPFQPVAADFGIEFKLACQDPYGNPTTGIIRKYTNQHTFQIYYNQNGDPDDAAMGIKMSNISGSDPWPTDRYLNIWVCDFNGILKGYATFPADYATHPNWDGVVVEYDGFGRVGNLDPNFNKGRMATHEIGHWLDLRHLWGSGTCGDDLVSDTPPQEKANSIDFNNGCRTFPYFSNCPGNGPNGDMFMNFMDYSVDHCKNLFTNGQSLRARAIFSTGGPRAAFIDNYFSIIAPTSAIGCTGNVKLFNPTCSTATWSIVSGPAIIINGQNSNEVMLQKTGDGTVVLRATGDNYIDEENITMGYAPMPATVNGPDTAIQNSGYYFSLTTTPWNTPISNINWRVPAGWSVSTGQGTKNVTIWTGTQSGPVEVDFDDACGQTRSIYRYVTIGEGGDIIPLNVQPVKTELSIYPNPANNLITVSLSGYSPKTNTIFIKQIKITSKMGVPVLDLKYSDKLLMEQVNISALKPDIYTIQVYDNKTWHSTKLSKE